MSTKAFAVAGPVCGTCLAELMEAIRVVPGVIGVGVTLVHAEPAAVVVTARGPVSVEGVAAAVSAVGFAFAPQVAPVPEGLADDASRIRTPVPPAAQTGPRRAPTTGAMSQATRPSAVAFFIESPSARKAGAAFPDLP